MTPARSVTKPCGVGIGGSGAELAATANATSSAAPARLRIGREGIDRGDDTLDLREIRGELAAQRPAIDAAAARPALEQTPQCGERPEDRLSGGQHGSIGERGVAAAQAEEVSEDDEEALHRVDHEPFERPRAGGRLEEECPQAEELPARFLLTFAPEGGAIDGERREDIASREHPMLAADVVELHREGVARAGEVLVVE